jgi:hypothetical protein
LPVAPKPPAPGLLQDDKPADATGYPLPADAALRQANTSRASSPGRRCLLVADQWRHHPAAVGLWGPDCDGRAHYADWHNVIKILPAATSRTQQPWSAHIFQLGHADHDTRIRAALLVQVEVVVQRSKKGVVVAVSVEPDEIDRAIAKRIA